MLAELDGYRERVPLDLLVDRIGRVDIPLDEIRPYMQFGTKTYRRNLMHAGPGYHALILCWRAGQRSPIHDHRGSSCAVRVLMGTAVETRFERTPDGYVYATGSRELHEGEVCGSQDEDMHQMSNLQAAGCDLVTLHVYSPPLMKMGMYSLIEATVGEFADPVSAFSDGGGI
jgi:cysteine dioxygenase